MTNNGDVFDIIAIGDPTLDTFLDINEAGVLHNMSADTSLICMSYSDLIPASSITHRVAGNATNNAVGSARLGLKTAFYGELGDDDTAVKVVGKLEREKVNCRYVKLNSGTDSNYTVVINYFTERTQLVYKVKRNYRLPKFKKSKWVYLTALGQTKASFYKDLKKYIIKNNVLLGFNPGIPQIRQGLSFFEDLLKITTVLLLNKEETKLFFNFKNHRFSGSVKEVKEYLYKAWDYGPDIMVITDGAKGAYAYDGKDYYHIPVLKVKVRERTGAGDAFSTGFISGLIHGSSVEESLVWGSFNSTSVIGKIGPQEGLLKIKQIKDLMKKHKRYRAVKI